MRTIKDYAFAVIQSVIDNLVAENGQTFGIVLDDFGSQPSPAQTRMNRGYGKNVASILAVHSLGTVGQIA